MKLNRLLTPILGVTTLSTVIVPITSCSNITTTKHIKNCFVSEKTANNNTVKYVLVLDQYDYDVNGFKVTVTVDKNDKSGAIDSDFECSHQIDGDHLVVTVKYVNEQSALEDDTEIKLNINVNYGTVWSESKDVKFGYVCSTTLDVWVEEYTKCIEAYPQAVAKKKYTFNELTVKGTLNNKQAYGCRYDSDNYFWLCFPDTDWGFSFYMTAEAMKLRLMSLEAQGLNIKYKKNSKEIRYSYTQDDFEFIEAYNYNGYRTRAKFYDGSDVMDVTVTYPE